MFIVILRYKKLIDEVNNNLEDHIKFLEKYYNLNIFLCSGRQEPRVGGIILCNAKDRTEINTIIKEDPFYKNEIAEYEIIEFIPTKYAEEFEKFVQNIE
ncbi:YciI family protein [Inconstantimicrobium mannanitabidum]|uniref:Uncharacterized protein n=1 Tax=Inconstantimicrobium mannanitabidum TaxID=1604901 RepID=A0ACB5RF11_9CLOT|nr:YciI family protein [Clostridium sp. TW13]GKX67351.1 hypothetical protein rsdtw13_26090 [Clostridium sp. TW13]